MSADLIASFDRYRKTSSIDRVRMADIPGDLQPLVKVYRDALTCQLADPDNDSWDSLGPNERYNALQSVYQAFARKADLPRGNCPRCAGEGFILAYSHVQGGKCLLCEGSRNVVQPGALKGEHNVQR